MELASGWSLLAVVVMTPFLGLVKALTEYSRGVREFLSTAVNGSAFGTKVSGRYREGGRASEVGFAVVRKLAALTR